MLDLSVKYMGLQLKNPIIAGSSGLSQTIDDMHNLQDSGVSAIVMKSIFEEQIFLDASHQKYNTFANAPYFETVDYIENRIRREYLSGCMETISQAKKLIGIPIIASINCISASGWTSFASKLQDAGADALELNIAVQSFDPLVSAEIIEELHLQIIEKVLASVSIPVAVKISPYFADMSRVIERIAATGVKGIVLFNRFISPDIDTEAMRTILNNRFSASTEMSNSLRWIAMKSDTTPCDLCASTGVHSGNDVIKILLSGGAAAQVVSTLYQMGLKQVEIMLEEIKAWMTNKGFSKIDQFAGAMRHMHANTPASYERMQYMKYNK